MVVIRMFQDLNAVRGYFMATSFIAFVNPFFPFFTAFYDALGDKTQDKDITSLIFSNIDT